MKRVAAFVIWLGLATIAFAQPRQVRVFVALCDNKTQGIMPVGAKIGNGDDPDANLYWGCTDGLGSFFKNSKRWKTVDTKADPPPTEPVLRRMKFRHAAGDVELLAEAYRGSQMKQCITDFERAATEGRYDLVAFIGHNGLMDFQLPPPTAIEGSKTQAIVLCCMSERYFGDRLRQAGSRPILMTQQLMYPGSFILDAAIESWRRGGDFAQIRSAAGAVYGKNQGISAKAGTGVFAQLAE